MKKCTCLLREKKNNKFFLEAGKYLLKVSEDDKLFSSYFWYRQYYKPDPPQRKFVKVSFNIFISIHLKLFHQIVINYLLNLLEIISVLL